LIIAVCSDQEFYHNQVYRSLRCINKALVDWSPNNRCLLIDRLIIGRLPINARKFQKPDILTLISEDCVDHANILLRSVID